MSKPRRKGGDPVGVPGRKQPGSGRLRGEVLSPGLGTDQALLNRAYRAITLIMCIPQTASDLLAQRPFKMPLLNINNT